MMLREVEFSPEPEGGPDCEYFRVVFYQWCFCSSSPCYSSPAAAERFFRALRRAAGRPDVDEPQRHDPGTYVNYETWLVFEKLAREAQP